MADHDLTIPVREAEVRALHAGDTVRLSGVMVTGRDAVHKYIVESLIHTKEVPESERPLHAELKRLLAGGVIYHCGPIVRQGRNGRWQFVAAGPTTSIRQEIYQPEIIAHFELRGIIGKGGMGPGTLKACQEYGAAYFHAVGGAATLVADAVKEVLAVHKKDEFGIPEALWVIRAEGFPVVVTMDSHGRSIHDEVEREARVALRRLLGTQELG